MMYTNYLKRKYAGSFKALALFVTGAFILSLNSCMTYSTENMTPQQFKKLEEPEKEILLKLTTKDSVINAKEYPFRYAKDQAMFFVEKTDTLLKSTDPIVYKKVKTLSKISLNDVLKITTEKSEFDMGKTLMWTGITIGSLLVIIAILAVISPPKMSSGL